MAVRVLLPTHLRTLSGVHGEVQLALDEPVTTARVLDALEAAHPVLRGTVRDVVTGRRRAFVRFYVAEQDLSHEPVDAPLPESVASGETPFRIVGAMAGG